MEEPEPGKVQVHMKLAVEHNRELTGHPEVPKKTRNILR
jgi:hypothetical protein